MIYCYSNIQNVVFVNVVFVFAEAAAATIAVSYALSHGPSDYKESFSFPRETRKSTTTSSRNSNLSFKKLSVMDSKSTNDYSIVKEFQSDEGYTQNEVVKSDLENGSTDHVVVQTSPHLSLQRFEGTQKNRYINMGITKKQENDRLRRWVGTKESAVRILMLRSDRIPRPKSFASSSRVNDLDSYMRSLRERKDLLCHFKKVECHSMMANSRIINWMKNEGELILLSSFWSLFRYSNVSNFRRFRFERRNHCCCRLWIAYGLCESKCDRYTNFYLVRYISLFLPT